MDYIDQNSYNLVEFDEEKPLIPFVIEPLNRAQMVVAFVFLFQQSATINRSIPSLNASIYHFLNHATSSAAPGHFMWPAPLEFESLTA